MGLLAGTAGDDGPSLIGWPILMVLAALALLAAGMRSAGPAEPRPAGPGGSDPPTVAEGAQPST